jgi:hypothetical protein
MYIIIQLEKQKHKTSVYPSRIGLMKGEAGIGSPSLGS